MCQAHGWPSISTQRHRWALAAYPMARASSPCRHLFGLAPDEACQATHCYQGPGGLLHRRFTLTFRPKPKGGLFSAALSLRSPWADVIRHRALWSPEVPQTDMRTRPTAAIKRSQTHNYTSFCEYEKPRKFTDFSAVCSRCLPKARLQ